MMASRSARSFVHVAAGKRCPQLVRSYTRQASPAQETENVRAMLRLAGKTRDPQRNIQPRMPTRLMTRSWAEEAQARAAAGGGHSAPLQELDAETEAKLLQPKRMQDSYVELSLPFKSKPDILERYIATSGGIRLGKVFEDLDNLAGDISYQHVLNGRPTAGDQNRIPIFIVTASVDRLDLLAPLRHDRDYRLSGQVIYVGSSAMEVLVVVEELNDNGRNTTCLTGRFTMATRNAVTGRSQRIAPLALETQAEKDLFQMGEDHKNRKREFSAVSLDRAPPTREEAALLHQQWLSDAAARGSKDVRKPGDTWLKATQHMHPQQRNVHMKVFGGFLMRAAYEVAWMCAASFVNAPVVFLALDALSFHAPVPIGALLSLSSQVTYTNTGTPQAGDRDGDGVIGLGEGSVAAVTVLAEVVDLETGERVKSNTFHFSFSIGESKRRVSPESYSDAMNWLEGKRRVDLGQELRQLYAKEAKSRSGSSSTA